MAGSVNKVILVGNLGRDPEARTTQSGMKIVNLAVATSETWNDRQSGERQERTEWHRIVIMNDRLADVAERFLRKGSKVYLEGKLQTRKWTDQSGQDKYTTEVLLGRIGAEMVLLDRPGSGSGGDDMARGGRSGGFGGGRNQGGSGQGSGGQGGGGQGGGGSGWDSSRSGADLDDEIPF